MLTLAGILIWCQGLKENYLKYGWYEYATLWIFCIKIVIIFYTALISLCYINKKLELYVYAVHDKGAALRNCWGFVNGTVRLICRPNERIQKTLYNRHKRVHVLKFQSVVAAKRLIANLYGPVERRRMTMECWLIQTYYLYFNNTAIGLMAFLFV